MKLTTKNIVIGIVVVGAAYWLYKKYQDSNGKDTIKPMDKESEAALEEEIH